jgi:hypothetical protein
VESVTLVPVPGAEEGKEHTIFRIRVARPNRAVQVMLFRLFFDDKPERQPAITVWDESGTVVMQSGELGAGIDLPTSQTVLLPMIGASSIDVEVRGDGKTVRGAYLDWMTSRTVAHPISAEVRDVVPEPFAAAAPLHVPEQDTESYGTVTASLGPEAVRIGASADQGATFRFGIETQPLVALLSFEVANARVDAPPQVIVNGQALGPAWLTLPDLADPGYRGESERLVGPMRFRYTGWMRAQLLIPTANLKVGTNDVIVFGGANTSASAIRATQLQLKYLWEKSDYLLDPK